jgi:nitrate/TMAO reductase-like tetraheme cytochrome c subunit
MKTVSITVGMFLVLFISIYSSGQFSTQAAQQENYCFSCHTNARKLIQITREIAEANKGKAVVSAQTKGEG